MRMVINFAAVLADAERVGIGGKQGAVRDFYHGFQAVEAPEHFGRIFRPHLERDAGVCIFHCYIRRFQLSIWGRCRTIIEILHEPKEMRV